ncbi:MAG: AraC family transcriptional regulator [Eubacteriales bacterium]|nr:AraC family transcriptional regulator [Eubacteriales bacterium]
MLIPEAGVHQISERYFFTPSSLARELFYYPTRCGHYFCDHTYSFSHQSEIALQSDHNNHIMLFLVLDGALELNINHINMLATRGQLVLFDCQQPYQYRASDGMEFIWLLFNGLNSRPFYQRILRSRGGKHVFSTTSYPQVLRLLDSLLSSCASGERMSEAACSQLLHRLLCMLLLTETQPQTSENDRITQSIRYMNAHLYESVTVKDIAEAVNWSQSHFSREFKAHTGYSPYEYIVLRRIDKAKHMLTSTRMTVKEIAYHTGYNSEENFIHSFQKNVGISPTLFRKYPI